MKKFNFVVDQDKILFADNIEDMAEIVKAMNTIVKGLNNENAYYYDIYHDKFILQDIDSNGERHIVGYMTVQNI